MEAENNTSNAQVEEASQNKNYQEQQLSGMGNSNSNPNNQSKLLQLNQNRFEDYLVQALDDSLMKKSK